MSKSLSFLMIFLVTTMTVSGCAAADTGLKQTESTCQSWCDRQYGPLERAKLNKACRKGCDFRRSNSLTEKKCEGSYYPGSVLWKACLAGERYK